MSVTGSCTTRIKHKTSLEPFAPPDVGVLEPNQISTSLSTERSSANALKTKRSRVSNRFFELVNAVALRW